MALPNDRITHSNDRVSESQKDPFGFDLAARCFTEQVRDSMAKISTMNVNAKTSQMLEAETKKPQPEHLELDAGKLFASTCATMGDNNVSRKARDVADRNFDAMVNQDRPVAQPANSDVPPWKRDFSKLAA